MEWYEWFFDGIGSQIISLVIGFVFGGSLGFFFGKKNRTKSRVKQRQKAGRDSNQKQIGSVVLNEGDKIDG